MNVSQSLALAMVLSSLAGIGAAHAQNSPITFAQTSDVNNANGLTFTNNGNGTGLLNTDMASGDHVNFSFENIVGVSPAFSGTLSAIELINGGAGVSTSSQATQSTDGQYTDSQNFNSAFTIAYLLAGAGGSMTNLLTLTITPITSSGYVISGQDEGTGGSSSTSNTGRASLGYTETFSSDVLKFQSGSTINASYSFSAAVPDFTIGLDGLLNTFSYDQTGTFSSNPPPAFVPEPGSLAVLAAGLAGLTVIARRRGVV